MFLDLEHNGLAFYCGLGQDTDIDIVKGKILRGSCRGQWSYVTWDLTSASVGSHCWLYDSIIFEVILRRSKTFYQPNLKKCILSSILRRRVYIFKQIIEYCITPESLIVSAQSCLGMKYVNMSRKILSVTANSDYTWRLEWESE